MQMRVIRGFRRTAREGLGFVRPGRGRGLGVCFWLEVNGWPEGRPVQGRSGEVVVFDMFVILYLGVWFAP